MGIGSTWSSRVTGISLVEPQFKVQDLIGTDDVSGEFIEFLSRHSRAYFVNSASLETPVPGRETFGCNCYSSGEDSYQENAMVRCWPSMLDWFNVLYANPEHEEVEFLVSDPSGQAEEIKLGW